MKKKKVLWVNDTEEKIYKLIPYTKEGDETYKNSYKFLEYLILFFNSSSEVIDKKNGYILDKKNNLKLFINIKKESIDFYISIHDYLKEKIENKFLDIFKNSMLVEYKDLEVPLKEFNPNRKYYETSTLTSKSLIFKYNDLLSITNYSLLEDLFVMTNLLEEDDEILLCITFSAIEKVFFNKIKEDYEMAFCNGTCEDYLLYKNKFNHECISLLVQNTINNFSNSLEEIITGKVKEKLKMSEIIKNKKNSYSYLKTDKLTSSKIGVSIDIMSKSKDVKRKINNLDFCINLFSRFEYENTFISKYVNIKNYNQIGRNINIMGLKEASNFFLMPSTKVKIENKNKIETTEIKETLVADFVTGGIFNLGKHRHQNNYTNITLPKDYNSESLPYTLIGGQGVGKTTALKHFSKDIVNNNQSLLLLDYIKNGEVALSTIEYLSNLNKSNYIYLDFGNNNLDYTNCYSFDLSEFDHLYTTITNTCNAINMKKEILKNTIDSLSNIPLTTRMSELLDSACKIIFLNKNNSVINVFDIFEDYKYREKILKETEFIMESKEGIFSNPPILRQYKKAVENLKTINEEDEEHNVIGTKYSEIKGLLTRFSSIEEDSIIAQMLFSKKKLNVYKIIKEKKHLIIRIPEGTSESTLRVLSVFLTCKILYAFRLLGLEQEKPNRSNFIIDEIYNVPLLQKIIGSALPNTRKFGFKLITTIHDFKTLDKEFLNGLLKSNSSFSIFKGSGADKTKEITNAIPELKQDEIDKNVSSLPNRHIYHIIRNSNGDIWTGVTDFNKD